jgi:hypothetical protein
MSEPIIYIEEYYYNPNLVCTCGAIFADTHRNYCKRRINKLIKAGDRADKSIG